MSNEEFNRKMEFIVEQQAQFAADIQVMREVHDAEVKRLNEETKQLREQDRNLSVALTTLAEVVENVAQTTSGQISALTENIGELTEAGRRTDDRLNVLINTVERYISGNGKKPSGNSP